MAQHRMRAYSMPPMPSRHRPSQRSKDKTMVPIPKIVFVLMLTFTTTKTYGWHSDSVWETMKDCRDNAQSQMAKASDLKDDNGKILDAHGNPIKWKCISYNR
jgi:hypothetical protein